MSVLTLCTFCCSQQFRSLAPTAQVPAPGNQGHGESLPRLLRPLINISSYQDILIFQLALPRPIAYSPFIMDVKIVPAGSRADTLLRLLRERIVILNGAMGTMIQTYRLDEAAYRGERFRDWPREVKGNNDLLSLTRPQVIQEIHRQYLQAGADIIETNTFNATSISQEDFGLVEFVPEMNRVAARLAREAVAEV